MASNNDYGAPMAYCDRHGLGYVKSVGCLDCLGMQKETKAASTKVVNDVVSVRVFPHAELVEMLHNGKLANLSTELVGFIILPNKAYLFSSKSNPGLIYFKLNNEQAIEITITLDKVP